MASPDAEKQDEGTAHAELISLDQSPVVQAKDNLKILPNELRAEIISYLPSKKNVSFSSAKH